MSHTDTAPPSLPEASDDIPEGFRTLNVPFGPYFSALGPLYFRKLEDGTLRLGLRLVTAHCNVLGIPHGGMLMTLADGALGINLARKRQPPQPIVTVNLSSDFLGTAKVGDWLEAHVTVRKLTRRLSFGECVLQVGERPILRSSGVFSVVERRGSPTDSDG